MFSSVHFCFDELHKLAMPKEAVSARKVLEAVERAGASGVSPQRMARFGAKLKRGADVVHGQMVKRGPSQVKEPGVLGRLMGEKAVTTPGERLVERGGSKWRELQKRMAVRHTGAEAARSTREAPAAPSLKEVMSVTPEAVRNLPKPNVPGVPFLTAA
jgi:hypothetical protein